MPNAADRPRRARTAAGANPPRIALDLARTVAAASCTADAMECCSGFDARTVTDALAPLLASRLSRTLRELLEVELSALVTTHRATCSGSSDEDGQPTLWSWLTPSAVAQSALRAFDAEPEPATLEQAIASAVAAGLDGERLTWELITRESVRHEGLIHKECNRLARTLPDSAPDDLKGYGWAGLRVALRNFDPALGYAFSTYACPKINGAIRDGVRAESPVPKRLTTFARKVSAAEEALTQSLGRPPSLEEIAERLNESLAVMQLLPRLSPSASLEELTTAFGERTRQPACLVDPRDPMDTVMLALRDEALREAVQGLPAEDAEAVRLLFLEEMPVGEAAASVGVEPRQLRARKNRGLEALRPVMAAWLDEHALV